MGSTNAFNSSVEIKGIIDTFTGATIGGKAK